MHCWPARLESSDALVFPAPIPTDGTSAQTSGATQGVLKSQAGQHMRVMITGAAGAGSTTLGRALANEIGARHLDSDDFFWLPSEPPFATPRDPSERRRLLHAQLGAQKDAVLSGSIVGWDPEIESSFDLIVFLYLEVHVRLARLRQRGMNLYGRIDHGFLNWAAAYDVGTSSRSFARHNAWLARRSCPVIRFEGEQELSHLVACVAERCLTLRSGGGLLRSNVG